MPRRARYTTAPRQPAGITTTPPGTSAGTIHFARDGAGAVYAIEIIDVEQWNEALLMPPLPEAADVRVVRLHHGSAPPDLPGWLSVEQAPAGHALRAAEAHAGYGTTLAPPQAVATEPLWRASPYHRAATSLDEFLLAAGAAVTHPAAAPTLPAHGMRLLHDYAGDAAGALRPAATLDAEPLERWLRYAFATPDALATAILIDRIARAGDAEAAAALRFLAAAAIPEHDPALVELAIDRRVVLEQASPWRYVRGEPFDGALAAARAWRQRYRVAYAAAYRAMLMRVQAAAPEYTRARAAAAALRRLSAVRALGPAVGLVAAAELERALDALAALPAAPDANEAMTAGVPLGGDPPAVIVAREASRAVYGALEEQR